ncbi:BlaI/MecI/CopY family transcriptional regulator [Streptomyces sp. So13.3]|uniref:BlaI/MecI/CopY family transcriptional regulator n=1 Tax=Streptomyces TaxID=1883 RepID=UPI0011060906|nr:MULTISPECIES: BlaI/MecI/CopY family transcriptional regulator [Streptomyces]MCZ4101633.1 BlaI/MecI/CopY family transcriptional regulator [Streptomyces sp. H39-C1]QNA76429.1 BlaI/MecI/CopY family transcriptional regulator [Streptomyces sp. So13.3]
MNDDGAATPAAGRRPNGALEAEVLAILQAAEEALTPAQAAERLGGGLSYSTVVTILSRLHAKGVLERAPRGRAYAYAPVTDAPGLAARQMHKVLGSKPDREKVLTRFVDDLSADDEQLLRRLLGAELDPGQ